MSASGVPSSRAQHLVFLAHVWACVPFMLPWTGGPAVQGRLSDPTIGVLKPFVVLILAYLVGRTWLAFRSPAWLHWNYLFPPLDVLLVTVMIGVSHRGPLSTLTLLYFFPIVEAAGSLSVRWAAAIGLLVVVGTAVATFNPPAFPANFEDPSLKGLRQLVHDDLLNVSFRVWFMIVVSSLMTYQARIAAEYRAEARLAEDRNRLALDVHDGVQGSLIAVASNLELIARVAETQPERAAALAREARGSARDAADELRFLVQRLRPPSLTGGFLPALRQYAHALAGRHGLDLVFEGDAPSLPPHVEQAVFHMVQEALNNIAKHAVAQTVVVRLSCGRDRLAFSVEDDGVGLGDAPEGTGRAGMRERTASLGGTLDVLSRPEGGTRVRAEIPIR